METLKLISEEIQDVEYICEEKNGNKDYSIKFILFYVVILLYYPVHSYHVFILFL